MIFGKGAMTTQWRNNKFFNKMVFGKQFIHIQKNEIGPLFYTIHKKKSTPNELKT